MFLKRITLLSLLMALSLMFYYVEGIIPPLPGLPWTRWGLSNVVTLLSLVFLSFKETFFIVLFRVLVGTLLTGTFLTPSFWLSFSGAMASTLLMGLIYYLGNKPFYQRGKPVFSFVGVSIFGAVIHHLAQLTVVAKFYAGSVATFSLAPLMIFTGLISGLVTGILTELIYQRLEKPLTQK